MANPKRGHCSNRDVVNAEGRLYSPRYDFDREEGRAWYEVTDADAMCFWGLCNHRSYNAWVDATEKYINDTLIPHYKKILARANSIFGGAALPLELADRLNKINEIINDWDNAGYQSNKTWRDDFVHPTGFYWQGQIRKIIDYYDEAACAFDDLDDIAVNGLKQPSLAKGAPARQLEHVEGGYLGGGGGPGGGSRGSGWGKAAGLIALGAAGYFGFKVLTE